MMGGGYFGSFGDGFTEYFEFDVAEVCVELEVLGILLLTVRI